MCRLRKRGNRDASSGHPVTSLSTITVQYAGGSGSSHPEAMARAQASYCMVRSSTRLCPTVGMWYCTSNIWYIPQGTATACGVHIWYHRCGCSIHRGPEMRFCMSGEAPASQQQLMTTPRQQMPRVPGSRVPGFQGPRAASTSNPCPRVEAALPAGLNVPGMPPP